MKLKKNIAVSETGFIFNPSTGDSFSVNAIGVSILQDMKSDIAENDITQRLIAEYDVNHNTAEKDLHDFKRMMNLFKLMDTDEQA